MIIYRLAQTLTETEAPLWDKLVQTELGEGIHAGRERGFKLAREALRLALHHWKIDPSIPEIELNSFHSLKALPQYTLSLSHTPHLGAAAVAPRDLYRSVGIDIEQKGRVVKDSIIQRVSHLSDVGLRNIELWCLKEAAFKAIMNTDLFEKPIEFSSIEVQESSWNHSPSGLTGEWKLEESKGHMVALAWIKN